MKSGATLARLAELELQRFRARRPLSGVSAKLAKQVDAILATCFGQQLDVIRYKRPGRTVTRKATFCTRRAGKTKGHARYMLTEALGGPNRLVIFVAKTLARAKALTWKEVEDLCKRFGVESTPDPETTPPNTAHTSRYFPNGSEIRWVGADNATSLANKRGDAVWLVLIDEAQDIESGILEKLVEDVFGPSLEDLSGTIVLSGTPGHTCAGYWYEVTRNEHGKRMPGWQVFAWSVLDNPYMAHMRERLPQLKAEKGWTDDSPTWMREWGRGIPGGGPLWAQDTGSLFYRFDPTRNTYDTELVRPWGEGWAHIRGWDLGDTDAMALVYWAFHRHRRELYEAYSWKKAGITSDDVVAHAAAVEKELGLSVVASVADTGGLGALVVKEVRKRTGVHFDAAKKTDKAAHVRMMNEDLVAGLLLLRPGSPLADEMAVLPKVADWDEKKTGKPAPEDPRFDNHCADAALYAWRRAFHYLGRDKEEEPEAGSREALEREAAAHEAALAAKLRQQHGTAWWDT